jgi:hypothetical protein
MEPDRLSKFALPFSDSTANRITQNGHGSKLYVLAIAQKTMTDCDLVLRDRRPTDLFAAALFSFQGANQSRSPLRKRIVPIVSGGWVLKPRRLSYRRATPVSSALREYFSRMGPASE